MRPMSVSAGTDFSEAMHFGSMIDADNMAGIRFDRIEIMGYQHNRQAFVQFPQQLVDGL